MHGVTSGRPDFDPDAADQVLARLQQRLPHLLARVSRASTVDELALDSLDHVELLCATEDEFSVSLSPDEFRHVRTVGELTDLIARLAKATRSSSHDLR